MIMPIILMLALLLTPVTAAPQTNSSGVTLPTGARVIKDLV